MSKLDDMEEVPLEEISGKSQSSTRSEIPQKIQTTPSKDSDETTVHEQIGCLQAFWFYMLKMFQKLQRWFRRDVLGRRVGPLGQNDFYEVYINYPEINASRDFPSNYMRTSKYTPVTFVPKNLFEQFRRLSNIYFATIIGLSFIPGVSPFIPAAGLLPLGFVMGVSAIKEAIEDYYRHKEDKRTNEQICKVIRNGAVVEVACQDVLCGDIVFVQNMQTFPCDIVLMSSSYQDGHCYVETSNIDGETNLKLRQCTPETAHYRDIDSISSLHASLQYELPNEMLYQFEGKLIFANESRNPNSPAKFHDKHQTVSVSIDNLLHRGAKLRNTNHIYGVAVYTGVDTKIFLNQQKVPSKFSTIEQKLNKMIVLVFLAQALLVAASTLNNAIHRHTTPKNPFEGSLRRLKF